MSRAPQPSKQSSRWGSFLQQAVAGVESRLDTILADGDEASAPLGKANSKREEHLDSGGSAHTPVAAGPRVRSLSGTGSNGRNHDRLQERLAKAVVVRSGSTRKSGSPASASGVSTPREDSPRTSFDSRIDDADTGRTGSSQHASHVSEVVAVPGIERSTEADERNFQKLHSEHTTLLPSSSPELTVPLGCSPDNLSRRSSMQRTELTKLGGIISGDEVPPTTVELTSSAQTSVVEEYERTIAQMQSDYKVSELRRQEETHTFMERIDALQSKLQYLTKQAQEAAKTAITAAPMGSPDKRLAEKDEQIALLLEEGEKLSKTELRHMNTIKNLRSSILEDKKLSAGASMRLKKVEQEHQHAMERMKRAEEAERRVLEKLKVLLGMEKENEFLKAHLESQSATMTDLKAQLTLATSKAEAAESAAHTDALEQERSVSASLRTDLSQARSEKQLNEENFRSEIRRIREGAERERERATVTETQLRGEQAMLESRLEVLHARAEEVSTGAISDAQAKLLRQVEVLQTQHAVASENWQGIESSLLHRIKSLEEEKDDTTMREGDFRRRTRDLKGRLAKANEELDTTLARVQVLEREFAKQNEELKRVQERLRLSEATLTETKQDFDIERASWEATLARQIEHERSKWKQEYSENPPTPSQVRTGSSGSYTRKGSSADIVNMQTRRLHAQAESMHGNISAIERPLSRPGSNQPLRTPDIGVPYRQESLSFTPQHSTSATVPATPSVQISDHDDFFEGSGTPASPHRTINDMISVSTAGAGPSVQLVERMSATVRRLESEKAALKDELARLSSQRDEAREQVVLLMREVEQKRAADTKIQRLEEEISQVNERYHTTLEMLGEKSEAVEELKADVADLKKIYKELVDSTMR